MRAHGNLALLCVVTISAVVYIFQTISNSFHGPVDQIYSSWSDSQLIKWLGEHDISVPKKSGRSELRDLVKSHWGQVKHGYEDFSEEKARNWLRTYSSGRFNDKFLNSADQQSLVGEVQNAWYGIEKQVENAKDNIFDTWSDKQLARFIKKLNLAGNTGYLEGKRDDMLDLIYKNYGKFAKKISKDKAWLFNTWSDADLKQWLDKHNIPTYQGSKRNELIAKVRRASHLGKMRLEDGYTDAKRAIKIADKKTRQYATDKWTESALRNFLQDRGIKIGPQTTREQLMSLVNAHSTWDKVWDTLNTFTKPFGLILPINLNMQLSIPGANKITTKGNEMVSKIQDIGSDIYSSWNSSSLAKYLEDHGIKSQSTKKDELLKIVRENSESITKQIKNVKDQLIPLVTGVSTKLLIDWAGKNGVNVEKKSRDNVLKSISSQYESLLRTSSDKANTFKSSLSSLNKWVLDEWDSSELRSFLSHYIKEIPTDPKEQLRLANSIKRRNLPVTWGPQDYYEDAVERITDLKSRAEEFFKRKSSITNPLKSIGWPLIR